MALAFTPVQEPNARILRLAFTCDESDDTVAVTAVDFYRSKEDLAAADSFSVPFSGGAAATTCDFALGTVIPAPTIIRLVPTFQA